MPRPFRFGVVVSHAQSRSSWVTTVRRIEELGYSSVLMPDRPSIGGLAPIPALAIAAGATTRLRVGSYVFCNDYRHPVLLAREAATLDLLSDGRFELGLGAGVGAAEFQQLGIPFESAGNRLGHLQETIELLKKLFTEDMVNFDGKYYTVTGMRGYPRPVQKPHMPILVAGSGERMLKLAGREADIVAIGMRITRQGPDPDDASLEQKVAWVKEAAGPRFADIELSQTIYDMQITDSGAESAAPAGGPPLPKRMLSTEQAVGELMEMRDRYRFSYFQVYEGQMENFAGVMKELSGR